MNWGIRIPYHPAKTEPLTRETATAEQLISYGLTSGREAEQVVINLVTTLRLLKEGNVAPGPLLLVHNGNNELSLGNSTHWLHLSKTGHYIVFPENQYKLLETEIITLKKYGMTSLIGYRHRLLKTSRLLLPDLIRHTGNLLKIGCWIT